jgi:hypothetical protein
MTASVLAIGAVHLGSGRRSATCSRDREQRCSWHEIGKVLVAKEALAEIG